AHDRRLLRAVFVAAPDGALWQLDPAARTLHAAAWPPELMPLRGALASSPGEPPPIDAFSAIVVALHPTREHAPRPGVLIAQINRAYLTNDFFPELARRNPDFDVAVAEAGRVLWRSQPDWPRSIDD